MKLKKEVDRIDAILIEEKRSTMTSNKIGKDVAVVFEELKQAQVNVCKQMKKGELEEPRMASVLFDFPWFYFEEPGNPTSKIIGFTPYTLSVLREIRDRRLDLYSLADVLNVNNESITIFSVQLLVNLLWTLESMGYINIVTEKVTKCGICNYNLQLACRASGADVLFGADSVILNTKKSRISIRND